MTSTKTSKGFTLIELMIAVAIISILAAIAIPSYNEYVIRSKLVKGVQPLAELKVRMNQWFDDNGSFLLQVGSTACGVGNTTDDTVIGYATPDFVYVCEATGTTYKVTAKSIGSLAVDAYWYTVNQAGTNGTEKHPTNNLSATCWRGLEGC